MRIDWRGTVDSVFTPFDTQNKPISEEQWEYVEYFQTINSDGFHEIVGLNGDIFRNDESSVRLLRERLFRFIDRSASYTWLILSENPERIMQLMPEYVARSNVWLGTAVSNQREADKRISELLNVPAPVHFVHVDMRESQILNLSGFGYIQTQLSFEKVDLSIYTSKKSEDGKSLDWVVAGENFEFGLDNRRTALIQEYIEQCRLSDTPIFIKGVTHQWPNGTPLSNVVLRSREMNHEYEIQKKQG